MFQIVSYTCKSREYSCLWFDLCSYYSLLTIVGLLQLAFLIVPGFFFEYKVAEESAVDKLDGENEQGQDEHECLTENVDVSEESNSMKLGLIVTEQNDAEKIPVTPDDNALEGETKQQEAAVMILTSGDDNDQKVKIELHKDVEDHLNRDDGQHQTLE